MYLWVNRARSGPGPTQDHGASQRAGRDVASFVADAKILAGAEVGLPQNRHL